MAVQMSIGDKPGISCCLISCAALAQSTSSGALWLSWTSVPLDRKTNLIGNIFKKCHGFAVLLILHRRSCSSKSMLRLCNIVGSFCHFASGFFLCPQSSYSISCGCVYLCPFFGLPDQEVFLYS